jgi:CorA-like Mg2+ transporter protein
MGMMKKVRRVLLYYCDVWVPLREVRAESTGAGPFPRKAIRLCYYKSSSSMHADISENPAYAYDVYIQRLACYVQHKEDPPSPPFDGANGISNPYKVEPNGYALARKQKEYLPQLSNLDNENAIIIFENSQSGSFEDCLIPARSEWETHWRRLPFYLAYEARDIVGNDDLLGRECARMILDDVFRALLAQWETLLDVCQTHVSILEDKIYEQPADETRAPELWRNSSLWLQLEKLTTSHMSVVRDMRVRLRELVSDITTTAPNANTTANTNTNTNTPSPINDVVSTSLPLNEDDWLEEMPQDFDRIATTISEDLTKPTQALISLLYQSVSIRDSRLSLQLNTSMWRLSWITFIFLPLTFMVGFFGMNVDTFNNHPSVKWYFIVSVPFMLLVLAGWYLMKHILARQRQTPYQRGIYEAFFHDMATRYPALWSRVGPREYVVPRTRLDRWRWWLIRRWMRPDRTIKAGQANADTAGPDDLSSWSQCKRYLIRKWTEQIITFKSRPDEGGLLDDETDVEQGSLLAEGLLGATEMLTVPGQPVASVALERLEGRRRERDREQRGHDEQVQVQAQAQAQVEGKTPPQPAGDGAATQVVPQTVSEGIRPNIRIERALSPIGLRRSSNSPRGRRPSSSGSGSRHSSVLVEEEDPKWINQLAQQGKGWYWRPGSPSPPGRGGDLEERRRSSGGSGPGPAGLRRGIDAQVGSGGTAGNSGTAGVGGEAQTEKVGPLRGASPLGNVIAAADQSEHASLKSHGDGNEFAIEDDEEEEPSTDSSNEAVRAAVETGGRSHSRDRDGKHGVEEAKDDEKK